MFALLLAIADLPADLVGTWSDGPKCSGKALGHVMAPSTYEWRDGARTLYKATAAYEVKGDVIEVQLVDTLAAPEAANGGPRAGDVVRYRRVKDGLQPLGVTRDGETNEAPADIAPFRMCRP